MMMTCNTRVTIMVQHQKPVLAWNNANSDTASSIISRGLQFYIPEDNITYTELDSEPSLDADANS